MPKPPSQCDVSLEEPEQPRADAHTHEASTLATRLVLGVAVLLLLTLLVMTLVGAHMPAGE